MAEQRLLLFFSCVIFWLFVGIVDSWTVTPTTITQNIAATTNTYITASFSGSGTGTINCYFCSDTDSTLCTTTAIFTTRKSGGVTASTDYQHGLTGGTTPFNRNNGNYVANRAYNMYCSDGANTEVQVVYSAPNAPTSLSSGTVTANSVQLTWSMTGTILPLDYNICFTAPSSTPCVNNVITASTSTSLAYTLSNLNMATTYTLYTIAQNSGSVSSANSNSISFNTPTAAPSSITVTDNTFSNFAVSWVMPSTPGNFFQRYTVCLSDGINPDICQNVTPATANSYTFINNNSIRGNVLYTVTVTVSTTTVASASASVTATTTPRPVTGFTTSGVTDTSVTASWTDPNGGSGISYRGCSVFGGTTLCDPNPITTTSGTYNGLTANTQYTSLIRVVVGSYEVDSSTFVFTTLPNRVTAFSLGTVTTSSIPMSWSAPNAGGNFHTMSYQACCKIGVAGSPTCTTLSTNLFGTPSGLTVNTVYTCYVRTRTTAGYGADSPSQDVLLVPTAPSTFNQNTASTTDSSIAVTWTAIPGPSSYTYQICKVGSPPTDCTGSLTGTSTNYNININNANTQYQLQITATDAVSQTSTATTLNAVSGPAPAQNFAAGARTVPTQIPFTWTAPNGGNQIAYQYTVCCASSCAPSTNTLAATVTGLSATTMYTCTISASNTIGTAASTSISASTMPVAPSGFSQTSGTATTSTVEVSWNPVTGTSGAYTYQICRAGPANCATATSLTSAFYTINSAQPNTQYTLIVRTIDINGTVGSSSSNLNVFTAPATPSAPTVGTRTSPTALPLTWTIAAGTSAQPITYTACCNDAVLTTCQNFTSSTGGNLNGLIAGTAYTCTLRHSSYWGNSATSTGSLIRTLPPTPTGIVQTGGTISSISLQWTAVTGGNPDTGSYTYRVCNAVNQNCISSDSSGSATTVTFSGAGITAANTNYTLEVYAIDPTGADSLAGTVTGTTAPSAATNFAFSTSRTDTTSIPFTWNAPSGSGRPYTYQVCCGAACSAFVQTTSTSVTGLSSSSNYTCTLSTSTGIGATAVTGPIAASTAPAQVSNFQQTATGATVNSVPLQWTSVAGTSGAYRYRICIASTTTCVTTSPSATTQTFTGLPTANALYSLTIVAIDSLGIVGPQVATTPVYTAPRTPTSITASSKSENSITVQWPATAGGNALTISYRVCLVSGSCQNINGPVVTAIFNGLNPNTMYQFNVQSSNLWGTDSVSSNFNLGTQPAAPTNVRATAATTSQITVQFAGSSGTTGSYTYKVCKQGETACTSSSSNTIVVYSNTLSANTPYVLEVYVIDGSSTQSIAATLSTSTAPNAPGTITVASNSINQVSASWIAATGGSLSLVYQACLNGNNCQNVTSTNVMFSALASNTRYTLSVSTMNTFFTSTTSQSGQVTTRSNPVLSVGVTARNTTSVTLQWSAPNTNAGSEPIFYKVCVNSPLSCQTGITGLTTSFGSLLTSNSYTFSVEVYNYNVAELSSTRTVAANTFPNPPATFTSSVQTLNSITVTWAFSVNTGSVPITGYTVCLTSLSQCYDVSGTTNLYVFNQGLTNETSYDFTVVAKNQNGDASSAVSLTQATKPPPPAGFQSTTRTLTSITLIWSAKIVNSYVICILKDQVTTRLCQSFGVGNGTNTYTYINLAPNTQYTFQLTETVPQGTSNDGTVEAATLPPATMSFTSPSRTDTTTTFNWSAFTVGGDTPNGGKAVDYLNIYVCAYPNYICTILSPSILSTVLNSLTPSTTTVYGITAKTVFNDMSAERNVTAYTLPPTVADVSLVQRTNQSIQISWTPVTQVGNDGTLTYTACINSICTPSIPIATSSFTFQNLVSSNSYTAKVNSFNTAPRTSADSQIAVKTLPSAPIVTLVGSTRYQLSVAISKSSGSGSITLRNYIIYVNGAFYTSVSATPATVSQTIPNLTAGTNNMIDVILDNVQGENSTTTSMVFATQPPVVPTIPIITKTSVSYNEIYLNWTAPSDDGGRSVTRYAITFVPTDQSASAVELTASGSALSYMIPNVVAGTNYTVQLTAVNEVGSSPAASVTVKTVPPVLPNSPYNLTMSNLRQRTAILSWSEPVFTGGAPILNYYLNVSGTDGLATRVLSTDGITTSFNILQLIASNNYTVVMSCLNRVGYSQTVTYQFTTIDPTVPGEPTGIQTEPKINSAAISWVAPTDDGGNDLTGFDIELVPQTADTTATPTIVSITNPSITSSEITQLLPGTIYSVTVFAKNSIGRSQPSSASTATMTTGVAPNDIGGAVAAGILIPLLLIGGFVLLVLLAVIVIAVVVVVVLQKKGVIKAGGSSQPKAMQGVRVDAHQMTTQEMMDI